MSSSEIECPHCGSRFDPDLQAGFCVDCGRKHPDYKSGGGTDGGGGGDDPEPETETGGGDGPENLQPPGGDDDDTDDDTDDDAGTDEFACPNCGNADVEPGDQFCTSCGTEVPDQPEPDEEPDGSPSCPGCGTEVAADANFCSNCGQDLSDVGGDDTDDVEDVGSPTPADAGAPEITYEVAGERIEVPDGEPIGREVREALLNGGHEMDEARLIHREHVEFQVRDDGVYLVDRGRNSTVLEGESLDEGDERAVSDGDSLELSSTAQGTIHID